MNHLFDTCTIIHAISDEEEIERIANHCCSLGDKFSISDEILKELKPPKSLSDEDCETNTLYSYIKLFIAAGKINLIDCCQNAEIKSNLNDIRDRYYKWMGNPKFCKELISQGKLTLEEYRSPNFRYKDIGECTLIAIALVDPTSNLIISEDHGAVYKFPKENLFTHYSKFGIQIMKYGA